MLYVFLSVAAPVEVTPELVDAVATHTERAPWIWVVLALAVICGIMIAGLVWAAKYALPWVAQQLAAHRESLQKMIDQRGADADRLAAMAVGSAHKELGERLADVHDVVSDTHEATKQVQKQLASIATKVGAPILVLLILWVLSGWGSAAGVELARAADSGSTKGGPAHGRPCIPSCAKPSVCVDGKCEAAAKKPRPAPGPHSLADLPAWADLALDRPGDQRLTTRAAELFLWAPL